MRREFWAKYPPSRVYICGDRATCWRGDIPEKLRGVSKKKGGAGTSAPTAHAWFVFERDHKGDTLLGHVWKSKTQK